MRATAGIERAAIIGRAIASCDIDGEIAMNGAAVGIGAKNDIWIAGKRGIYRAFATIENKTRLRGCIAGCRDDAIEGDIALIGSNARATYQGCLCHGNVADIPNDVKYTTNTIEGDIA